MWGVRQRLLFIGIMVSATGLAVATWFYAARPRKPDIAAIPPLLSLMLWESLKMGVDVPPNPGERAEQAGLESSYRWAVLGLAVAVIGAGILAGSLCVGRTPGAKSD